MKYLLEKGKIGKVEIKNKVIMSAIGINSLVDMDGGVSDRAIDYYLNIARGGVGMIISGSARVEEKLEPSPEAPFSPHHRLNNKRHLPRLNTLVELLHDYDTKFFIQLTAGVGRIGSINPVAPSAIPVFSHSGLGKRHQITKEISFEDIQELIERFAISAKFAYDSGVDGIEIHGHEGYLQDQFSTELWNKRKDKYGGSTENRIRLACEIIQAIKGKTNADFPIIYQYGAEHRIPGGRELDESIKMAKILEANGADALRIDSGCYENWHFPHPPIYQKEGLNVDDAAKIKQEVNIPVITMGKLGRPAFAESILKKKKVDFISLGRPLFADPEWVNKVANNQIKEIRPCIGDHEGCLSRGFYRKYISCTVNPQIGAERYLKIEKAEKIKKIFVIGGGPAGMEATRVAALRGHNVQLFEKGNQLGGLLIPASVPPHKREIEELKDYFIHQMKILPIKVHLNFDVEKRSDELLIQNPDCIFIANGSRLPDITEIIKIDQNNDIQIVYAIDVLEGEDTGEKVVVLGGGLVGCETALYLKSLNKDVTILECESRIAENLNWVNQTNILELLNTEKINIITNTKLIEVNQKLKLKSGENILEKSCDSLVVAIGSEPDNILLNIFEGKVNELYQIGDCKKPGKLLNAIWSGFRKARIV